MSYTFDISNFKLCLKNCLTLKYIRFTPSGFKDRIREFELVAKTSNFFMMYNVTCSAGYVRSLELFKKYFFAFQRKRTRIESLPQTPILPRDGENL